MILEVFANLNDSVISGKTESSTSGGAMPSPSTTWSASPLLFQEEERRGYSGIVEETTTQMEMTLIRKSFP